MPADIFKIITLGIGDYSKIKTFNMKKLISILLCSALSTQLLATIRTVSNVPSTIADFSDIQAACDASASGDSIYISGSPQAYTEFTINDKKLAIFGPGWSPDKEFPISAMVHGCELTGVGAAGSELHGLTFTNPVYIRTLGINNIRFIRNRFQYPYEAIVLTPQPVGPIIGYTFEGNWFDESYIGSTANYSLSNFRFENNIFYRTSGIIFGFTNTQNVFFLHNLWYSTQQIQAFYDNCRFLNFSDNIFVNVDAYTETSSCRFSNNITFNTPHDIPWKLPNIDGGGNLAGTNPQMADQTSVNNGEHSNLLLNFALLSNSPGKGKGSDGKDIGLLYDAQGNLNWTLSRSAHLPLISRMNVTTTSVVKGEKIAVIIEAKKN